MACTHVWGLSIEGMMKWAKVTEAAAWGSRQACKVENKNQDMLKITINNCREDQTSYSPVEWGMDLYLGIMGKLNPVGLENWGHLSDIHNTKHMLYNIFYS